MIQEKLLAIQIALKAPKGNRNTFGNYNYRSCEDILEAVKPILNETGCTLRLSDELVNIGERYYIKAEAILVYKAKNLSEDYEVIRAYGYAREAETQKGFDQMQLTGSTSSYARKYALNGLFLIDDTKDSDFTNTYGKEEKKEPKKKRVKESAHAETETIKKEDIEKIVFDDIHTRSELSRTWIDLTKEQQEDDEIKGWFTVRKLQLGE